MHPIAEKERAFGHIFLYKTVYTSVLFPVRRSDPQIRYLANLLEDTFDMPVTLTLYITYEKFVGAKTHYQQKWPEYDEAKTVESTVEIAVQINGKVKATLMVGLDEDEASVKEKAHVIPVIAELTAGKNIVKEIYVKGRILNVVVKN